MYCSNCGKHNSEGSKFCEHCGSQLIKDSAENKSVSQAKAVVDPPKTENKEPLPKDKKVNAGLGGWLALVGLGMIVGVVWQSYSIFGYFSYLSNTYTIPGYSSLLWFEFLIGVAFIGSLVYLIYLYFKKKKNFPKYYVFYLIASIVFALLDWLWVASLQAPTQELQKILNDTVTQNSSNVSRTVVQSVIWILYMLKSKQVKATFIEDK